MKQKKYLHFMLLASCFLTPHAALLAATPAKAKHAMVVSEQALASQVGIDILRAGGNAIDAAVAVGYALAVVHPCCGNIGGGGFMTLHLANGKNIFINFREKAPRAATATMFLDTKGNLMPHKSTTGYLAVAVPGTVLGFETALRKYGTMSRQQVIAPAIQLAEKGFILTPGDVAFLTPETDIFKTQKNIASIFLKNGKPYQAGDRLIQTDLANTLKQIAEKGANAFYRGAIADKIVEASQEQGGILSRQDFTDYRVQLLPPIICYYRGYQIISAPPPSSGGTTLCEILQILQKYPLHALGHQSPEAIHATIEAMRFAFADRNDQLGDPDFVNNPIQQLLSKKHITSIWQRIRPSQATPSKEIHSDKPPTEGKHTTHYSIMDKWGNAASVTYTLNSLFGAKVIPDHTGIFLNDEMDDFTTKAGHPNQFGLIQGVKNSIAPGKRPLSSMTPTIITKNGKVVLIVGSPGGPRIITATLLTILNVIDYNMNLQDAVNQQRYHQQWLPDTVYMEPDTLLSDTQKKLEAMQYHFTVDNTRTAVEAIYVDPITKQITGANDRRRPAGKAMGY